MRKFILFFLFIAIALSQLCLAQDPTDPSPTPATTIPTTTPTTTTTTTTTPGPTPTPAPKPGDNPLDDGKKFGISVLVYVCCLIAWSAFLFLYSKIIDHCACCKKGPADSTAAQKYATSQPTPAIN